MNKQMSEHAVKVFVVSFWLVVKSPALGSRCHLVTTAAMPTPRARLVALPPQCPATCLINDSGNNPVGNKGYEV